MTRYWPRRAPGLPPGQRLMHTMPRFTDVPQRPPPAPAEPRLEISRDGAPIAVLTAADLDALRPREHRADFHCVTTWSMTGLVWTGVPLREVLASVGITGAAAPYLVARGGDGHRIAFVWEDAVAPDVILATALGGSPLDARHGAPLRLVSPSQYGYKSVKHLVSVDLRAERPKVLPKEHLRARVAAQERHPKLPSWLVAWPYRIMIPAIAYRAERTLRRWQAEDPARADLPSG
jgi:DMSO/TMAO reductase YedYZ molybdopterin-dependent catalytic subunit